MYWLWWERSHPALHDGNVREAWGCDRNWWWSRSRMLKSLADTTHTHTQAVLLSFSPLCPSTAFMIINGVPCSILLMIWAVQSFIDRLCSGFFPLLFMSSSLSLKWIKLIWPVPQVDFWCIDASGMLTHQCAKQLNLHHVVWLEMIFLLLILLTAAICCSVCWTWSSECDVWGDNPHSSMDWFNQCSSMYCRRIGLTRYSLYKTLHAFCVLLEAPVKS